MPCDSIITNTVDLGQIGDHDMMERALKAKYGSVSRYGDAFTFSVNGYRVTLRDGQAVSQLSERQLHAVVSDVKKAYSRETVYESADQFGWLVEQGENPDEYVVYKN